MAEFNDIFLRTPPPDYVKDLVERAMATVEVAARVDELTCVARYFRECYVAGVACTFLDALQRRQEELMNALAELTPSR